MKRKIQYINKSRYSNKSENSAPNKSVMVLAASLVLFLLAQLLSLSVVGTKGAELAQIQSDQEETKEEIRLLESEISEATSLDRIEVIAKEKLGMVKTSDVKYLDGEDYISNAN